MAKAKAKTKPKVKAKPKTKAKAAPAPKVEPSAVEPRSASVTLSLGQILAQSLSPNSPVPNQRIVIRGYVRDRQAQLGRLADMMKASHGKDAGPIIDKICQRIELLNPIKDCEVKMIVEALFM